MDALAQIHVSHCTDPSQLGGRINLTFWWTRQHTPSCPVWALGDSNRQPTTNNLPTNQPTTTYGEFLPGPVVGWWWVGGPVGRWWASVGRWALWAPRLSCWSWLSAKSARKVCLLRVEECYFWLLFGLLYLFLLIL